MATLSPTEEKVLKQCILRILENIKISDRKRRENREIVDETVKALVEAIKKENRLFAELYKRILYTGSYYEGLRIKEPNEFDLNVVLHLPFNPNDVEIQLAQPAFAKYYIKKSVRDLLQKSDKWDIYEKLEKFFDERRYLLLDKLYSWLESAITKATRSEEFVVPKSVTNVKIYKAGPAFTLEITKNNEEVIDVDLVPCIKGPKSKWPKGTKNTTRVIQLLKEERVWYLIPKRPKHQLNQSKATNWRIAFPAAEKALIRDKGCVKELIRLLKCLRDEQNWSSIASYYIKTLINNEIDLYPPDYWHPKNKAKLLIEMLQKLKTALEMKKLPHYFYPEANLLEQMKQEEAENIAGSIKNILKDIQKDPKNILKYFGIVRIDHSMITNPTLESNYTWDDSEDNCDDDDYDNSSDDYDDSYDNHQDDSYRCVII